MHPWLLTNPPLSTYGVCLVAGIVVAWLLARRQARQFALDPSRIDLMIPLLVAAGIAGAFACGQWVDALTAQPVNAAVLVGALAAGTAAGIFYGMTLRWPLGLLGDLFAAPVALVIMTGRIGCFFAGCCYGQVCEGSIIGVHYPSGSPAYLDQRAHRIIDPHAATTAPVIPVQLLEATACFLLATVLLMITHQVRRGKFLPGTAFLAMALGYSALRFTLEFWRADNPPIAARLTFSQWASVAILLLAATTLALRWRFANKWNLRKSASTPPLTLGARPPMEGAPTAALPA